MTTMTTQDSGARSVASVKMGNSSLVFGRCSFLVRRRAKRTGRDAVRHAHTVNPVADTAPKVDSRCHTTLTGCSFVSLPSLIVSPQPKKTRLLAEADSVMLFHNCS